MMVFKSNRKLNFEKQMTVHPQKSQLYQLLLVLIEDTLFQNLGVTYLLSTSYIL